MQKSIPSRRQSTLILIGSIAALLAAPAAQAATLYWDANGTTAGSAADSSGTWGVNNYWNTDSTGGASGAFQSNNASSDDLYFTAGPSSISTITVSGIQSAHSITIQSTGNATLTGGTISLGAGGLSIPAYTNAGGTFTTVTINSALNLTADQTWTNNGNFYNYTYIKGDFTGSGNITVTSNNSYGRLIFSSGSSTGWTGSLTKDGGTLIFANSTQLTTRLNSSTLTLKNNASEVTLQMQVDAGKTTNFTNNISFGGTSTANVYNFATGGAITGGVISLSGNLSGNLTSSLFFRTAADQSGTGQLGQYRISGNNSGLTSSAALTTSGSAIVIGSGYVVLDSANALGTSNSLAVQLCSGGNWGAGIGYGLLASNGNTVTSNITVAGSYNQTGEAYLGLDGIGSVLYSGSINLTRKGWYYTNPNNLHLRALAGGTATFSGNIGDVGVDAYHTYVPVIVDGGGTVILTGSSTYMGNTTVSAGKLAVNGKLLTTGSVTVASGGTLGGSGTVGNVSVQSGGHFAAGNSITTTFTTTSLSLAAGSITDVELGTANATRTAASTGTTNDRTTVTGALALGGVLNLIDNVNAGSLGNAGAGSYLLFTASSVTGGFSSINNISGYRAKVDSSAGNSVYLDNYKLAGAAATQTINLGNYHVGVGKTASVALSNTSAATNAAYVETLASNGFSNTTTGFSASGAVSGVTGGTSGTGTLAVSVGTTLGAGVQSGTTTLALNSEAVNNSGLGTTSAGSQTVTINATGYNLAAANNISSTPVNLGITHVSGTFTAKTLSIQNTAPTGSYTEGLNASGTASGVATVSGSIGNLVAGGTSTAISVGLGGSDHTGSVGIVSGTVAVGLVSSGSNSGLDDTPLDTQNLTVTGQVNNYANPIFGSATADELGGGGTSYTLTLGNFVKNGDGSLTYSTTLTLANTTISNPLYQDALEGKLTLSGGADVTDLVCDVSSVNLESGSSVSLILSFNAASTLTSGTYSAGMLTLNGTSVNSSESTPLSNVNVDLNFVVVPEPSTWAMLVGGLGMLAFGQRLRRRMS